MRHKRVSGTGNGGFFGLWKSVQTHLGPSGLNQLRMRSNHIVGFVIALLYKNA